jgi:RimJ/RimL family protein N-acetyltransferase
MREMLEMAAEGGVSPAVPGSAILTIRLRGEAIGVHELTHVAARSSGMMHAHIWNRSHRGLGIGLVSYVKAMQKFFERFDLKQIVFETPEANIGARQIKARLGIAPQGRGSIKLPISYRVLCSEIPIIERNMRAAWQQRQAKLPAAAPPEAWAPGE